MNYGLTIASRSDTIVHYHNTTLLHQTTVVCRFTSAINDHKFGAIAHVKIHRISAIISHILQTIQFALLQKICQVLNTHLSLLAGPWNLWNVRGRLSLCSSLHLNRPNIIFPLLGSKHGYIHDICPTVVSIRNSHTLGSFVSWTLAHANLN